MNDQIDLKRFQIEDVRPFDRFNSPVFVNCKVFLCSESSDNYWCHSGCLGNIIKKNRGQQSTFKKNAHPSFYASDLYELQIDPIQTVAEKDFLTKKASLDHELKVKFDLSSVIGFIICVFIGCQVKACTVWNFAVGELKKDIKVKKYEYRVLSDTYKN